MPCDTPGGYQETVEHQDAEIAELTALLCELCTAWEAKLPVISMPLPPSVRAWWAAHQARDRERAEQSRLAKRATIARLERQRKQIDEELAALQPQRRRR